MASSFPGYPQATADDVTLVTYCYIHQSIQKSFHSPHIYSCITHNDLVLWPWLPEWLLRL